MSRLKVIFLPIFVILLIQIFILFAPNIASANTLSWYTLPSLPHPIASTAIDVEENRIHVFSGATGSVYPDDIYSSDLTQLPIIWNTSTIQTPALLWHMIAKVGEHVFLIGGATFPPIVHKSDVYLGTYMNGKINGWQSVSSLPEPLSLGASVVVGNKIFISGGQNDLGVSNRIYMTNVNTDGSLGSWTLVGNLPIPLKNHGMIEYNGHLIIIGGDNETTASNKVFMASISPDGSVGSWSTEPQLPENIVRAGIALINNTIYVIGGNNPDSSDRIYTAGVASDGSLNNWTLNSSHIPQAMCCMGIATSGSTIYLAGGYNLLTDYLDSVYYANTSSSQSSILDVPYFNQKDLPWGPAEYDHAAKLKFGDTTFARWGCAVTSSAMVLRYHGMTQLPDGQQIDPGTLNEWLKNNEGFVEGKGKSGTYSFLNWEKVGILTRDLYNAGKSTVKLVHRMVRSKTYDDAFKNIVKDDVNTGNDIGRFPDIVLVTNSQTSGHFVVAKGDLSTTFAINDPYWNHPDLTSFGNTFGQIDRFIPSHTDFSTIHLVVNPDTEILVTDPQGRKTGRLVENGAVQVFNEIPDANYDYLPPINNQGSLGVGVNDFLLKEPIDGQYTVTLSSNNNTYYTFNASTIETNGDNALQTIVGTADVNSPATFMISYSTSEPSSISKDVTFESTFSDLTTFSNAGLIDIGTETALASMLTNAKRSFDQGNYSVEKTHLVNFEKFLDQKKDIKVDESAVNGLTTDASSLLSLSI